METFAEMFERPPRPPEYRKVLAQAKRVRRYVESLAKDEHVRQSLLGYCAIASAELFRQLKKVGVDDVQLAMWIDDYGMTAHVFLLWQQYVVDITATQFARDGRDIKDVEIRPLNEAMNMLEEWQPLHVFEDPIDLRRNQMEEDWPEEQLAFASEMM